MLCICICFILCFVYVLCFVNLPTGLFPPVLGSPRLLQVIPAYSSSLHVVLLRCKLCSICFSLFQFISGGSCSLIVLVCAGIFRLYQIELKYVVLNLFQLMKNLAKINKFFRKLDKRIVNLCIIFWSFHWVFKSTR